MTPVVRISSATQPTVCRRTSSARAKASTKDIVRPGAILSRLSLRIVINASVCPCIRAMPACAVCILRGISKWNGVVTTPMERMPISCTISATTGAAPVPNPPPIVAAIITRSEPASMARIALSSSRAACSAISTRPPVPRPFVSFSPTGRTATPCLCSVFNWRRSELIPTSVISRSYFSRTQRTILLPPPPTPTTLIVILGLIISAAGIYILLSKYQFHQLFRDFPIPRTCAISAPPRRSAQPII